MYGDRPAVGLMTFSIETIQESYKKVQELGISDPISKEQDFQY